MSVSHGRRLSSRLRGGWSFAILVDDSFTPPSYLRIIIVVGFGQSLRWNHFFLASLIYERLQQMQRTSDMDR
jgi:hypothetical protein